MTYESVEVAHGVIPVNHCYAFDKYTQILVFQTNLGVYKQPC